MIKLSLITVVYNDCTGLKNTVASVDLSIKLASFATQIEHIIIDGGSTDGTVEYALDQKKRRSVFTTIISEHDEGIYDAMNKGVKRARGEGVLFLNAGDEIHPEFRLDQLLQDLSKSFANPREAGVVYNALMKFDNMDFLIKSRPIDCNQPRMPGIHQAMLYKRTVLVSIPFDISFKICGDYDNFAIILGKSLSFRPIDRLFAIFYAGGVSSSRPLQLIRESYRISTTRFQLTIFRKQMLILRLLFSVGLVQILLICTKLFSARN